MNDLSGQVVKGYELRELIGMGGFAAVYRAYQFVVEREVAIKVILSRHANAPDFIRRFEAEAQLIARLEHIHIVPLYDYWRQPNNAYLVMRWLRGGSLFDLLQKQRIWGLNDIARLLDQIAAALMVAHRNGVVHQDLTPGNILFDDDNNAYLTDFGIAKRLSQEIEQPGKKPLFGTPTYMSPEQIRRQPVTPQTDIYSLGIILYQLLTGTLPFDAPKVTDVLHKQINDLLPPLKTIRPDLPYTLDVVLLQATSKNPATRYTDARGLANAFRSAIQRAEEPASSSLVRVTDPTAPVGPETADLSGEPEATSEEVFQTLDFAALLEPQNPYKGLRAFEEADAVHFFGREGLVRHLLAKLSSPAGRFLAVIGPSGSGKSSVVKAGLIPLLRSGAQIESEHWFVARMVPGAHPLQELETALLSIAVGNFETLLDQLRQGKAGLLQVVPQILPDETAELVLIIDQFEEAFTLVEDETERNHFLDSLVAAVKAPSSRLRIIITLRADFYDRPLLYPGFGELVQAHTEVVLPLSSEELQEVIVGPAERAGVALEPGLVAAIVADVTEQPGALPLLQYALTELFERREDHLLTLDAYRSSGGVRGALARRAEELYQSMEPAHQDATRRLFLRLVSLDESLEDTRRRARWAELMSVQREHKQAMQAVMDAYGKYRLITFDHDPQTREPTVEVAHEALIREWVRLRGWLDENRDELRTQRRLAAATAEWIKANRDGSFLATGTRLAQFETLVASTRLGLTDDETTYVHASIALRKRAARRVQLFIAALVVFSLVALTLAVFAVDRQQRAENARATSVAERDRADEQAKISRSRELAVTALRNIEQLDQTLLLSLEALKAADTFEARNSLLTALQSNPHLAVFLSGHQDAVRSVTFSADGRLIASGSRDGAIILWDAATRRAIGQPLTSDTDRVNSVVFSPDARLLASGGADGAIRLWDVETGAPSGQPLTGHEDAVWGVAFSPDGRTLASGSSDGTVMLWDVETGERLMSPLTGHQDEVYAVAFSPDGQRLASAGADMMIILWDVSTGEPAGDALLGHEDWIYSLAFSPDGRFLASSGADNTIRLWDVETGEPVGVPLQGHTDWVRHVTFSPDGAQLVSASSDGTVRLWDVATGTAQLTLAGHGGEVWSVAVGPDGDTLASGDADGRVVLWNTQDQYPLRRILTGHYNEVASVTFSPDGQILASSSGAPAGGGDDLSVRLWDVSTGEPLAILTGHEGLVSSVAFSPDGSTLVSAGADRTLRLWDVESGEAIGQPLTGHTSAVFAASFSPDGQMIASAGDEGTVILWDVGTGQPAAEPLTAHEDSVLSVAFSPDGRLLASGDRAGVIVVWDMTTRQPLGAQLNGHTDAVTTLLFSPDGRLLASGSRDATVILWDTTTWQAVHPPLAGHTNYVTSVTFGPDGQILASGSWDGAIILWDVVTGRPLGQPLTGHQNRVSSVAFSPDGRWLASGSWDFTIGLWDVSLASWQTRACFVANRNLTSEEWEQYFPNMGYSETCPE
jgi:WD40 repeat protein/serine/threonine protein kinase/energy-coupling factor transporter ATP-binding protein EcfA2